MSKNEGLIPLERVEKRILSIRDERVIIDSDLAELYGVTTKALNQAVKRNLKRFPDDIITQLTAEEKRYVVTNCDHLEKLKFSPNLPKAFTEHGALMAANILNSERAVEASVQVVRAFVKLRQLLASNAELARKVEALEKKYDTQFKIVFDAIKKLMMPPDAPKGKIGFVGKTKSKSEKRKV